MSNSDSKARKIRVYNESPENLEPIRFITARRFWILVYLLMGSTGLAMLLARFLVRPIMTRVLRAQQEYQAQVNHEFKLFVTNLAKSITALPGRKIIVDTNRHRLFVNTETQTETEDTESQAQSTDEKENKSEVETLKDISTKIAGMGQETEEQLYDDLSTKMSDLRTYLYELDSASYKSSYSGFGTAAGSTNGGDAIQKFKAEIRSVKGTMLNARTFTSNQSRPNVVR